MIQGTAAKPSQALIDMFYTNKQQLGGVNPPTSPQALIFIPDRERLGNGKLLCFPSSAIKPLSLPGSTGHVKLEAVLKSIPKPKCKPCSACQVLLRNDGIDDLLNTTVNRELEADVNHPTRHRILLRQTRLLNQPMVVHGDVASQPYSRQQQV
ncbi:unnamed protein product [Ectocarpus sp. 12 AP-2014]